MFAEVIIDLPIQETFVCYSSEPINKFQRVYVEFNKDKHIAFVTEVYQELPKEKKFIGKIKSVIDKFPILPEKRFELAKFISEYYSSTLSESIFMMLPKSVKSKEIQNFESSPTHINSNVSLTEEQELAYIEIRKSLSQKPEIFLLYGVTGSGKTEIYKKLVEDTINENKSCILLVPEISLTPQLIERFSFVPSNLMAVYHSRLSDSERYKVYMGVLNGKIRFVIGPRSVIFLPFRELSLAIVDEFHETAFKSSQTPRYHTKDILKWLNKETNTTVVLGSATPLVEDFYLAQVGKYKLLRLTKRYATYQKVETEILDMSNQKNAIHPKVLAEMGDKVKNGEQVITFINRRGFSNLVRCDKCGFIPTCPDCDVSLTYHKSRSKLECHHCGHNIPYTKMCPNCQTPMKELGYGTERAEEILKNIFRNIKVGRVDLDTLRHKESYEEIYQSIKNKSFEIIVGTQLVSKGLDLPFVNLVCILFPDITLRLPDFYSNERTFSLITQAIGRAGRRDKHGKAIIQTFSPDHFVVITASNQDFESFYKYEIERRERYKYPPFYNITRFIFRSEKERNILEIAKSAYILLEDIKYKNKDKDVIVSPPLPCPISKISGNYRYQIIFRSKDEDLVTKAQKTVYKSLQNKRDVYIEIDRNPISLL